MFLVFANLRLEKTSLSKSARLFFVDFYICFSILFIFWSFSISGTCFYFFACIFLNRRDVVGNIQDETLVQ